MKKFVVDTDSCIGCGACCAISETFVFNDEGLVEAVDNKLEEMDAEAKEKANNALEGCPVGAIKIEEA